jgi:hypothetical protein
LPKANLVNVNRSKTFDDDLSKFEERAVDPIAFLDKLVKGVVLATYDFLQLTVAGLFIPFVRRRPKFWRTLITVEGRLSSLTYLVLWSVLATAIGFEFGAQLIGTAAGLVKESSDSRLFPIIMYGLIYAVLADATIHVGFYFLRDGVRRRLYRTFARIAFANIIAGASFIMVLGPLIRERPIFTFAFNYLDGPLPWLPNPLIFPFGISFAVIAVRAFAIRSRLLRLLSLAMVVVFVPVLLYVLKVPVFKLTAAIGEKIAPSSKPIVSSSQLRCDITDGKMHIAGEFILSGVDRAVIKGRDILVYVDKPRLILMGRTTDADPKTTLTKGNYVHIERVIEPTPEAVALGLPDGPFRCILRLSKNSEYTFDDGLLWVDDP